MSQDESTGTPIDYGASTTDFTISDSRDPAELAERRAQYAICRVRGHAADWAITQGWGPTKNRCRYCGTLYWTEQIEHEEGAPE